MTALLLILLAGCTPAPGEPEILGIGLSPNDPRVTVGSTVQLTAKAFYDDYSTEEITARVDWASTDTRVATVGSQGLAEALAEGTAGMVATWRETSASVDLTVTGAQVTGVTLVPSTVELHEGDHVQLTARASFSDGTEGNLAGSCSWSSDDPAVALVDGVGGVDALRPGETRIRAEYGAVDIAPVSLSVVEEEQPIPWPDLRVTGFEAVALGDEILYEVEVANRGTGHAGEFYLYLYLDSASEPSAGDDIQGIGWLPGLAAGERTTTDIDVSGVDTGSYSSWVLLDPDDWVEETDESNNLGGPLEVEVASGGSPDLVIVDFQGLTDGDWTLYSVEVANVGDATSGSFWLDLYYDELDEPESPSTGDQYAQVPTLEPWESWTWEPEASSGPDLYWFSWVLADSLDDVAESDETNNTELIEVEP